ncbi:MAG: sigma factor-like helix-turn-helix DNA-binding protein [archaeon]
MIKEEWRDTLKLKYGLHNQIDRDTIRIRYGIYIDEDEELTFEQIAEIYDVTKQNVQKKEKTIFNHIRKYRAAKDLGLLDSEKEESEIIKLKHGFHTDKDREVFEQKYGLKIQPGDKISIREIAKLQEIPYRLVKDKERGTNQVIKEYLEAA